MEFEYICHDTTSLIFFYVASGRMEIPYLNPTRTEADFVKAVEALVSTNPSSFKNLMKSELLWVGLTNGIASPVSRSIAARRENMPKRTYS